MQLHSLTPQFVVVAELYNRIGDFEVYQVYIALLSYAFGHLLQAHRFITSNGLLKCLSLNSKILSLEANVVVPNIRAAELDVSLVCNRLCTMP